MQRLAGNLFQIKPMDFGEVALKKVVKVVKILIVKQTFDFFRIGLLPLTPA